MPSGLAVGDGSPATARVQRVNQAMSLCSGWMKGVISIMAEQAASDLPVYRATVESGSGDLLLIKVEGVGATQARHEGEIEEMTSDLITCMTDQSPGSFRIDYERRYAK